MDDRIEQAVAALAGFCDQDVTAPDAIKALSVWRGRHTLQRADYAAILTELSRTLAEPDYLSGGGMNSGPMILPEPGRERE